MESQGQHRPRRKVFHLQFGSIISKIRRSLLHLQSLQLYEIMSPWLGALNRALMRALCTAWSVWVLCMVDHLLHVYLHSGATSRVCLILGNFGCFQPPPPKNVGYKLCGRV